MGLSYHNAVPTRPYVYETTAELFDKQCETQPDREAFIFYDENLQRSAVTFLEAYEQSLSVAAGMMETFPDLKVGDRICICTRNNWEYLLSVLAAFRLGLVAVLASAEQHDTENLLEIAHQSSSCGVIGDIVNLRKTLVCETLAGRENWKVTVFSGATDQALAHEEIDMKMLIDIGNSCPEARKNILIRQKLIDPDKGALIAFSSGSTGPPKAILFTHFQILNEVRTLLGECGYRQTDKQMLESPFCHLSGLFYGLFLAVCFGASSVSVPKYLTASGRRSTTYLRLINREKCTIALVFGYTIFDIINDPAIEETELLYLRLFITGGQILSEEHLAKFIALFPNLKVINLYGLSECMVAANRKGTDLLWMKIIGNLEVKIIHSNNEVVPLNSPGVLCFRTRQMMAGYIVEGKMHDPRDDGGWFRTDDTAMMNESGELFILGRISDIISRGPANVSTVPLEKMLDSHPKIQKSAIVPVPDPRLGSDICACVIPVDNTLTETDLLDWCATKFGTDGMGISLRPKCCVFFEEFPLTTAGKISKPGIKNIALDRLFKQML